MTRNVGALEREQRERDAREGVEGEGGGCASIHNNVIDISTLINNQQLASPWQDK